MSTTPNPEHAPAPPEQPAAAQSDVLAEMLARWPDDPLLLALRDADVDDEPLTPEDLEAIAEGQAAYKRGEGMTLEEFRAQFERERVSGDP